MTPKRACSNCAKLSGRIAVLEERLRALEARPRLAGAFAGERLISRLVKGVPTLFNAAHDVTLADGTRIEIKFSRLGLANPHALTKRWTWHKPYGISERKQYERLILVGETDPRTRHQFSSDDPYIYFDVPFERVPDIRRPDGLIQISTDPKKARTEWAKLLYGEFLITGKQLTKQYGRGL